MKYRLNKIFRLVCLMFFLSKFFKQYPMEEDVKEDENFLGKPVEVGGPPYQIVEPHVNATKIIGKPNKLKICCKSNCCKVFSFIYKRGFKILVLCFLAAQIIELYFLINQLLDGCDEMKERCNTCANELTQCEKAYEMAKSLAEFALKLWNNCPNGQQDIIDALEQFKNDCCNTTQFELKHD